MAKVITYLFSTTPLALRNLLDVLGGTDFTIFWTNCIGLLCSLPAIQKGVTVKMVNIPWEVQKWQMVRAKKDK